GIGMALGDKLGDAAFPIRQLVGAHEHLAQPLLRDAAVPAEIVFDEALQGDGDLDRVGADGGVVLAFHKAEACDRPAFAPEQEINDIDDAVMSQKIAVDLIRARGCPEERTKLSDSLTADLHPADVLGIEIDHLSGIMVKKMRGHALQLNVRHADNALDPEEYRR
ncbi:MAG TPA: hypothetical protein VG848_04965, partial [Acetobacteraceae bacterium]|nr:hypothetical protein [Acetobacteraceae bacterium]